MNEVRPASHEEVTELPAEFDVAIYHSRNPDLRSLSDGSLARHYISAGFREGRPANRVANRTAFAALIPQTAQVLEIGPFANPLKRGPNVKYLDVLSTELLRARARTHGVDPANCPDIDFVSETGDLAVVTDRFDAVLSSHVIEHQPDLLHHFTGVADVLTAGGRYYLAVPDKRFCFDHFIAESSVAQIVTANVQARRVHTVCSVIEHAALTTHNDPVRHWAGDHGEPVYKSAPAAIGAALATYDRSHGVYLDVHAWQFTPESLRDSLQTLFTLGMSPFRVLRVYATVAGSNEFYVVLEKASEKLVPANGQVPAGFDESEYLLAHPDVARSGMSAAEHYVSFGQREGRKLRR